MAIGKLRLAPRCIKHRGNAKEARAAPPSLEKVRTRATHEERITLDFVFICIDGLDFLIIVFGVLDVRNRNAIDGTA